MTEAKIQVAVRVRPPLDAETILENGCIVNEEGTSIQLRNMSFNFDYVFNHLVPTKYVYETLVSGRIKNLFEGYNCTILAYGATGSGKTYTMGTHATGFEKNQHCGLIPLGLKDIFDHADSIVSETDVAIEISFFEIYMDNIRDLLKTEASFVFGYSKAAKVTNRKVTNYNEALEILSKGVRTRTTAVTVKNSESSRSHAFYIVSLCMTNKSTGTSKFSKFQLVDLAGSERAGTDLTGKEFKQGVHINKGLTALGRVISSLFGKERHIPYRDSLLTRYLQDSFGGNSYTVMVTCINPAFANVEETLSSLRYSHFASKIKNIISVNMDPKSEEDFQKKIEALEKKNEELERALFENRTLKDERIVALEKKNEELERALFVMRTLNAERIEALEKKNEELERALEMKNSTAKRKASKNDNAESCNHSMIQEFLDDDDDMSFTQESVPFDPDYCATPLWKRNKPHTKRRAVHDNEFSSPEFKSKQRKV